MHSVWLLVTEKVNLVGMLQVCTSDLLSSRLSNNLSSWFSSFYNPMPLHHCVPSVIRNPDPRVIRKFWGYYSPPPLVIRTMTGSLGAGQSVLWDCWRGRRGNSQPVIDSSAIITLSLECCSSLSYFLLSFFAIIVKLQWQNYYYYYYAI
jgi:hypothetical protein